MEQIASALDGLASETPFLKLSQPFAGVTALPQLVGSGELGAPSTYVASTRVGNVSACFSSLTSWDGRDFSDLGLAGACADEQLDVAIMKSMAEALERYAMAVLRDDEVIWATAEELGEEALDWRLLPTCSRDELVAAEGIVTRFDPSKPIRWVRGYSLTRDRFVMTPAVLSHLSLRPRRAERFFLPISTGVAVHRTLAAALTGAALEVIERDALMLTWLLRRPLPEIVVTPEQLTDEVRERFERVDASLVRQRFFDATTDIGVPTVYALQMRPRHPHAATVVTAACDFDPLTACSKALREAASTRISLSRGLKIPATPEACVRIEDGAAFMGRPERNDDFDFLLHSRHRRRVDEIEQLCPNSANAQAAWLVNRFKALGLEAVLVDLTTRELRDCGLRAVRVLVPALMPLSFVHRARFLAHPRLNAYGRSLRAEFDETCVNPMPQPFA